MHIKAAGIICLAQILHKAKLKNIPMSYMLTPDVPPTFIVHAFNDPAVNVRNSLMFYNALVENNVNASIHIFPQGGHGIRLYDNPGLNRIMDQPAGIMAERNEFFYTCCRLNKFCIADFGI